MGKKKHKRERKHGKHARAEVNVGIPPQVAGIAAAALKQVNSPAFRQMMAGALGAAARAFDQRRSPPRPDAPPPPASPAPSAYQPRFETPARRLSPEAAQTVERITAEAGKAIETAATLAARGIETATAAFERWAASQRDPRPGSDPAAESPHD